MSAERIRQLNDAFRTAFSGRNAFVTAGVQALGPDFMAQAIAGVREYTNFTPDNDPHGEHDFGSLKIGEHQLLWKIDYYETSMTYGSDDPSDPAKTTRVLTIMLAEVLMRILLDLSEGEEAPVTADVIAILFDEGRRLFAAKARVDDAPWYGLIHEDSTAFVQIEY